MNIRFFFRDATSGIWDYIYNPCTPFKCGSSNTNVTKVLIYQNIKKIINKNMYLDMPRS